MQVTPVTQNYTQNRKNINFKGFQRIKLNMNEYTIAEREIFPAIKAKEKGFLKYILGDTPFEEMKYKALEYFGELNGAGVEWAANFAKKLGLKVPFDNPVNTFLVVTGEKDVDAAEKYLSSRVPEYAGRMKKHVLRNVIFTPVEKRDEQMLISNFIELDKEAAYFNEFVNMRGAKKGDIFNLFLDKQIFSEDKESELIYKIILNNKFY